MNNSSAIERQKGAWLFLPHILPHFLELGEQLQVCLLNLDVGGDRFLAGTGHGNFHDSSLFNGSGKNSFDKSDKLGVIFLELRLALMILMIDAGFIYCPP